MQPSPTLYSGIHDGNLLKFCSEECKGFWFPAPEQQLLYVASYLDGTCQSLQKESPLLTFINRRGSGVEQVYLSFGGISEGSVKSDAPYIVWHIRELNHQYFAHFYISKDCLPLKTIWTKQYCTSESEIIYNKIATRRLDLQFSFLEQLNQAVRRCSFENFEAFLMEVEKSKGVCFSGEQKIIVYYAVCQSCSPLPLSYWYVDVMVPEEIEKTAALSNLPPGFTFCNPDMGLAHGSLKSYIADATCLLHYTEDNGPFKTTYVLDAINLFSADSPLELHFIYVKHNLDESRYFADGAVLSNDGTHALKFLLDEPFYDRGPNALEELNGTVERVIPQMLRRNGVPSLEIVILLMKYTW